MKSLLLFPVFYIQIFICSAQTFTYTAKALGINAGTLTVNKKTVNLVDFYQFETHSEVDYLLGKIKVDHITKASYKSGTLQNAYVRNEKNGEVEYYSSTTYDGSRYETTTEKGKKTLNRAVNYSLAMIFFSEPAGKTEIFSERLGEFVPIKKTGDHMYEVTLPDGDKYTYRYTDGKMVQMDVPSPVGRAHFYLNN